MRPHFSGLVRARVACRQAPGNLVSSREGDASVHECARQLAQALVAIPPVAALGLDGSQAGLEGLAAAPLGALEARQRRLPAPRRLCSRAQLQLGGCLAHARKLLARARCCLGQAGSTRGLGPLQVRLQLRSQLALPRGARRGTRPRRAVPLGGARRQRLQAPLPVGLGAGQLFLRGGRCTESTWRMGNLAGRSLGEQAAGCAADRVAEAPGRALSCGLRRCFGMG